MKKSNGFVLADNLVALGLMAMVASFFCLSEQQLSNESHHAKEELHLARIAKEATDQLDEQHQQVSYDDSGMTVTANPNYVKISKNQKQVFMVCKE